jgi:hypothetical protein
MDIWLMSFIELVFFKKFQNLSKSFKEIDTKFLDIDNKEIYLVGKFKSKFIVFEA